MTDSTLAARHAPWWTSTSSAPRPRQASDDAAAVGARHRVPGRVDGAATGVTGSSATTSWWPPRSATGSGSRRSGSTPSRTRSRSTTASSPRASRRRATRRGGTATAGAGDDPLAPGVGAPARHGPASGPRTTSTRSSSAGECEFVHDLTCPVPAAVTLEWLGYPARGVADVLGRLPRRLRVPGRIARAPQGVGGVRPGAAAGSPKSCGTGSPRPRDDALTAIAHHEVDGVRLPEDIAKSITFLTTVGGIDTTTSLTGAALLHLSQHPGRSSTADRRARPASPRHGGVPPLLSAGACPQAHRRGRHRVRWGRDEAG